MANYYKVGAPDFYGMPSIKGTVYTSLDASSELGYYYGNKDAAMVPVVDYLAKAFDYKGVGYEIYGVRDDYPALDTENAHCSSNCNGGALGDFSDYLSGDPYVDTSDKEFNLCVTNAEYYGNDPCNAVGCAHGGGWASVAEGAWSLTDHYGDNVHRYHSDTEASNALHTCLMEAGHNLGMDHQDGLKYEKDSSTCAVTPQYTGFSGSNSCGDSIADCSGMSVELDMYYSTCAINNINV